MADAPLSLFSQAVDAVEPIIASLHEADRGDATPCPELDLKDLVAHLIGGFTGMAAVAAGEPLELGDDPDLTTQEAAVAFRRGADLLRARFGEPGATERTFPMPWGPTTGAQLLGFELIEVLVHGWDIARATGTTPDFDPGLVGAALADARLWADKSTRVPHLFGPEVPVSPDAPILDQLVAFLGRDPAWTPT